MAKLTKKQELFANEYIVDFNATKAALRAGYSKKTAYSIGHENLNKPDIQGAIRETIEKKLASVDISQERVLLEVARIAFNDPRKAFDENGNLLPIQEWPDEVAAAVSSIEVVEVGQAGSEIQSFVKKVRFWDKGKQVELAMKYLKMLTDKVDHTSSDGSMSPKALPAVKFKFGD
jgi:phage terminase small subunit